MPDNRNKPSAAPEVLFSWLCLTAGMFIVSIVFYYRLDDGVASLRLLNGTAWICMISILVSVASLTLLISRYSSALRSKDAQLSLALGVMVIAFVPGSAELMVRFMTVPDSEGVFVGDLRLLPRSWPDLARQRRNQWKQYAADSGIFIFHNQLGWTIAPNKKGIGPAGERMFSSAEGTRALDEGIRFDKRTASVKIALLGDSYVFGSDVNYEETWGFKLQEQLGANSEVINFGVPGYGIDQAYLRYLSAVRPLHPQIVILGLISHDLIRTTMVYYAVGFPGAVAPAAKPRFTIRDGELKVVNIPLLSPEALYDIRSIEDLPYIRHDRAYRPAEWQSHWYQLSFFLRFLVSWCYSCGLTASPADNDETVPLNRAILQSFVREVIAEGSIPLIAFLPSFTDFRDAGDWVPRSSVPGVKTLANIGVNFVDLTPCMQQIEEGKRFTAGWHYTPYANSVIATCLHAELSPYLSRSSATLNREYGIPQ